MRRKGKNWGLKEFPVPSNDGRREKAREGLDSHLEENLKRHRRKNHSPAKSAESKTDE